MQSYFTAIIFTREPQPNGKKALKYRNIGNNPQSLQRFEKFAAKFPTAEYINYYDRDTKQFVRQQRITEPE